MVDETKPYAPLFSDNVRERVRRAMEADKGYRIWTKRQEDEASAAREQQDRVQRLREEMRAGKQPRMSLPELDYGI